MYQEIVSVEVPGALGEHVDEIEDLEGVERAKEDRHRDHGAIPGRVISRSACHQPAPSSAAAS